MFRLTRHSENPILKPDPQLSWETEGVFNPGVVKVGNEVVMLYRAVGERDAYISHIGLAKSSDGIHFERFQKNPELPAEPVFGPSQKFDIWATEDPRITKIGNDFYITYVAVPDQILDHGKGIDRVLPLETATALLKTSDFISFENLGIISPLHSDNKDIVLFPRKVADPFTNLERYIMLHRPNRWDKQWLASSYAQKITVPTPFPVDQLPLLPSMWIAYSNDLITWTDHQMLLSPSHEGDAKIGPGLPPIETPEGWLVIYHHVEKGKTPDTFIYSVRVALLDLENPSKIIAKLPYDILTPEMPYETENNARIVFPTGGFISEDTLFVYYGASDRTIGLATGSVSELLSELKIQGVSGRYKHETD